MSEQVDMLIMLVAILNGIAKPQRKRAAQIAQRIERNLGLGLNIYRDGEDWIVLPKRKTRKDQPNDR